MISLTFPISYLFIYLLMTDSNIFFEASNLDTLQTTVNTEMCKLVNWLNSDRLALNISKTNFVIFSVKNKILGNPN